MPGVSGMMLCARSAKVLGKRKKRGVFFAHAIENADALALLFESRISCAQNRPVLPAAAALVLPGSENAARIAFQNIHIVSPAS